MSGPRNHLRPLVRLAGAASLLALTLDGCGGGAPRPAGPPASSATPVASSASATASAPPAAPASAAATALREMAIAPVSPPPTAGSTKVTVKNDPAWATCHQGYEAKKKDVSRDVQAMAAGCAKITKMKLLGTTLTGKQGDQEPPQSFPFKAEASHCYRVYAQGSEGIKDLDLAIKDGAGAIAGEDSTDDPSPVILEDGAVCFKQADSATVVVSVGMGKGTYALEIWKD